MKTLPKLSEYVINHKSKIGFKSEIDRLTYYNSAYLDYTNFITQNLNEDLIKEVFKLNEVEKLQIKYWLEIYETIEDLIPYNLEVNETIIKKFGL